MKKSKIMLALSLIIILIGSIIGFGVESDFGKVTVKEVKFTGPWNNIVEGYLYVPKGVTKDHPAPAIINIHGYLNTKEFQTSYSIEFARRGYVVLAIDMPGHGYSDPVPGGKSGFEGFFSGGTSAFKYLSSLDFVNKDKIAMEGHSMGGWNVAKATEVYGNKINTVVITGSAPGVFGLKNFGPKSPFNIGFVMGDADEFAGLNWGTPNARIINTTDKAKAIFGIDKDVVYGQTYGSFKDKTARALYQVKSSHAGEPISTEDVGYALSFVQQAMPAGNPIDPSNQVWPIHDFGTFLNLIGLGLFIISLGGVLLDTKFFDTLKQDLPEAPAIAGGRRTWLIFALLAAAIPPITYLPLKGLTFLDACFIPSAWWRPQNLTYAMERWALVTAAIFFVLFLIWHFAFGKRAGGSLALYGVSTSVERNEFKWSYIGKSFLLAAIILGAAQTIATIVGKVFMVDFRVWVVGVKALDPYHVKVLLLTVLPYFAFFLVGSLAAQSFLRLKDFGSETKTDIASYIATIIVNGIGMLVLVLINLHGAWSTGIATFSSYTLEVIIGIQFIIVLPFTGIVSTYYNRKTGNIYTSAFINSILISAMIVISQASMYFPVS